MDSLITCINEIYPISPKAAKALMEVITVQEFKKEETFVKKGLSNNSEYVILNGYCRSYVHDQMGNELTLSFYIPNTAITPNLIRTKQNLSVLNLHAISDCKIATFSAGDLASLMGSNREISDWANTVLQKELLQKVEKEINQASLNAKERLLAFRDKYPALENQIPHAYIASYLGITTVSLSRIRKELSLKNR